MEIIQRAYTEEHVEYSVEYTWLDDRHGGFAFPCDADGNIDRASMAPAGLANLAACESGEYAVRREGVREYRWSYRVAHTGRCSCGTEVYLDSFTNTCGGCGADYNSAGQLLAPRCQWGEETGEHWSECY